jgi:hypothetical protein
VGGFISLNELERTNRENPVSYIPVSYIIEGLLPADDVRVAVGDSGLGKTPWAYQLGLCVTAGKPFLGHATQASRVLYYDFRGWLRSNCEPRSRPLRPLGPSALSRAVLGA